MNMSKRTVKQKNLRKSWLSLLLVAISLTFAFTYANLPIKASEPSKTVATTVAETSKETSKEASKEVKPSESLQTEKTEAKKEADTKKTEVAKTGETVKKTVGVVSIVIVLLATTVACHRRS